MQTDHTEMIINRTVPMLSSSAIKESYILNWSISTELSIEKFLVQWCHGTAGVITAMESTPQSQSKNSNLLDDRLKMAGELVWKEGSAN